MTPHEIHRLGGEIRETFVDLERGAAGPQRQGLLEPEWSAQCLYRESDRHDLRAILEYVHVEA
jgi:hypothetical protein